MSDYTTLENGQKAPTFCVDDSEGNTHDLEAINASGKGVILYFYPRDSTPGCTIQACDFRDQISRLNNSQYIVLGVSKDSAKSHDNFIAKQQLNFPLLMDEDLSLHNAYGTWRMKMNYGKEYMGCARSTFVINPEGDLIFARYNVKAKNHVEMLIRELDIAE
ncbi:MAG: peroxiredoxin [Candidatus Poseidoniaceae archaeon]|nr:peroxiredoxin [Candidatus Poseidoniaceae archaeon]